MKTNLGDILLLGTNLLNIFFICKGGLRRTFAKTDNVTKH